jgi:hypothetical protein
MNLAKFLAHVRLMFVPQLENHDAVQILLKMREVIADRADELLVDRKGKRAGSFDQMTYLASLYGEAALLLSQQIRHRPGLTTEQQHFLERLDQNIDELLAHETTPYFTSFALPTMQRYLITPKSVLESAEKLLGAHNAPTIQLAKEIRNKYLPLEPDLLEEAFKGETQLRLLGIQDIIE